ncbi:MAG TPA: GGDEF domain-containing protein [Candidatus Limnocylindrales bacterium]|nr:GGDEF domain-containing protein [Candidatus Limnocylindrales bacterium]
MSGWSSQQLTEFLAAVSAVPDEEILLRSAAERAAEAVESEVAAIVLAGRLRASIGFSHGDVPDDLLQGIAAGRTMFEIPGLGSATVLTASVEYGLDGVLIVARAGVEPFTSEDKGLLRGMARVLALALRQLRLLEAERVAREASEAQTQEIAERQRLLEGLSDIQGLVTQRAPLQDVLDAITAGVERIIADELVGLRLIDPDDPSMMTAVSASGSDGEAFGRGSRTAIEIGATGLAVRAGHLVVIDDYATFRNATPSLTNLGLQAAMAAPVYREGAIAGSLVVASTRRGRHYSETERAALSAFADLTSMALTDGERTRQMLHSALHDALTGLPNRALFLDRLAQRLAPSRRPRRKTAVLFIDLDQLKYINDSLGHLVGDQVLVGVGQRLQRTIRAEDTVSRISGDEFAVLLHSIASEREGRLIAERVLEAVREPFTVGGRTLVVSASVGVRFVRAEDRDAQDVMRGADLAMYEAKASGRGRVGIYRRELDDRALRRLELEEQLRTALRDEEFRLVYQPIIALRTGRIAGVEALVRWRHPDRGTIPPSEFVGLAEETGLIVQLGEWVLRESCRQVAEWGRLHPDLSLQLSVNLSARQLLEADLSASVRRILHATGLPAHQLTLEVTESILLRDTGASVEQLQALRRMGVAIAIDDFGTGYSSLSYLQRLPVDAVKIDRSFVNDVASGARSAAFVRAILQLCRTIELRTVAEGVETAAQAAALKRLKCDLAQGFFFSHPLDPDQLETRLSRESAVLQGRPVAT